jgi:cytochrome c
MTSTAIRLMLIAAVAATFAAPTLAQAPQKLSAYKGDAAQGAKDFVVCKACHSPDKGVNKIGPSLFGVVGRTSGSIPGFKYSAANKAGHIVWTPDVLFTYLANPKKMVPGTYMTYAGLADPQKRANVIAYLSTLK